jgi:AAA+ ATPase superfamily predicted ATPase
VYVTYRCMLFSGKPKTSLKDFFDRQIELKEFASSVDRGYTVVKGIRRIGKSSLIKVGLRLSEHPHIYLDLRGTTVRGKLSSQAVLSELIQSASEVVSTGERVRRSIKDAIREIDIAGVLTLKLRQERTRSILLDLFTRLNRVAKAHSEKIVIAFDEAQVLRLTSIDMRELLANVYDNMENLTLVFAGSEVGVLDEFIGVNNPSSPFYGRYMDEVSLKPLTRELSLEFLRRGFAELSIKLDDSLLEKSVDELDGVIGWLTYFGLRTSQKGKFTVEAIEEVLEAATRLERAEIESLPSSQRLVLAAISKLSTPSWSDIKHMAEALAQRKINDGELNRTLRALQRYSLIEKRGETYAIIDPITKRAASQQ